MRAWTSDRYGRAEVLQLKEVADPAPGDNEVVIDIRSVSLNAYDWHNMRGEPFLARLSVGLLKPKKNVFGSDASGVITGVGRNVKDFQTGDEIFGEFHLGGFGERLCASTELMMLKPPTMSFEDAAALPMAGVTALQGLRDRGRIKAGQKVLVNGASGGVGHFAVQIAKAWGADVTGVCSTGNLDLVRSLGADSVIDYKKEDFCDSGKRYDLVLDAVGNKSVKDLKKALVPDGSAIVVGFTSWGTMLPIMLQSRKEPKKGKKYVSMMVTDTRAADLDTLLKLTESGKLKPHIESRYSFEELPAAVAQLETGRARGKIVVSS